MITAENAASHELIGLGAEVVASANPHVVGLNGRVINETKSMITMDTQRGPRHVAKGIATWRFDTGRGHVTLEGRDIAKRPFERTGGRR